jgi:hypothetical protein
VIGPVFVTDLLRLPFERIKHLPAQDRYFLSQEAEEGDPMCIEEAANATIDSRDGDSDGFDKDESDEEFDLDEEAEDYEMV